MQRRGGFSVVDFPKGMSRFGDSLMALALTPVGNAVKGFSYCKTLTTVLADGMEHNPMSIQPRSGGYPRHGRQSVVFAALIIASREAMTSIANTID